MSARTPRADDGFRAFRSHVFVCALAFVPGACGRSSEATAHREGGAAVIALSAAPATAAPRARRYFARACAERAKQRCDVQHEPCQIELFGLASCVSGREGERPPLRVVSEAEARQRRLEHRARASGAQAALERAVRTLGLGAVREESDARGQASLGASAYYSPRDRVVYFVADAGAPADDELAVSVVVHEYVHALQDHRGELLAALRARDSQSFDRNLTLWSTFEGEATLYEEVVRAFRHGREPETWIVERFAARTNGSDEALVRQRRPLEAAFASFPYTYGGYWAALETRPPASTHELLAKRHAWPLSAAEPCEGESPATLAPDHPPQARDSLGAWLVQGYVLRHTGDWERARSAARRFRGDWLSLDAGVAKASPSFVWQTCWDSEATARELHELLAAQLGQRSDVTALVTQRARRVTAAVRSPRAPTVP